MAEKQVHAKHRERMRKRFLETGFNGFSDHEILEFLLFNSIPRSDTNPLAHTLLDTFGSLSQVLDAEPYELMRVEGVGERTAVMLKTYTAVYARYLRDRWRERPRIDTLNHIVEYMRSYFVGATNERFYCVCLTASASVCGVELINEGVPSRAVVFPRRCLEAVIKYKATYVVLIHNHPSGNATFSRADLETTEKVQTLLMGADVRVLDHVIIAGDNVKSAFVENILSAKQFPRGFFTEEQLAAHRWDEEDAGGPIFVDPPSSRRKR